MVSETAYKASVQRAVDNGVAMGADDTQTLSSNTDEHIVLTSMIDGTERKILRNDAQRVLLKRLSDGQPAFWAKGMPGKPPQPSIGSIQCMLHPDFKDEALGADRAWIDSLGLAGRFCNMMSPDKPSRADFKSIFDRDDHMAKKHRREWQIIERAIARREKDREQSGDAAFRDALLALAGKKA